MKELKKVYLFIVIVLFLMPLIIPQTIVEVQREDQGNNNFLTKPFEIFKSRIFWGGVVIFAFIVAICVGLFFVIRWLIQYIKTRSDVFYRLRNERLKLAKIHRRYPSKAWLKIKKNTPIRLVKKEGERLIVTRPIGHHRGDYVTHEGNIIISMNLINNKKWFFFPVTDLLIIPNKDSIDIMQKSKDGIKNVIKVENLPKPSDIVRFNEDDILLFCESLSNTGMFLIPVLKSKDGKIIDLSMPVFDSLKQVILGEYLYEQTDEFGKLAKRSMEINPNIRAITKTQDTTQNVEIPQST